MGSYVMDEMVGSTARVLLPYGHAEVLKTHSRTELVAGADPDQARLGDFGRRWEVDRLYSDHREMLERETPEVVSIASPPTLHAQHVVDCAERGVKGIFCEKPIAPTLAQADEMIRACEAKGAALAINHVRRGDPYMQQAHKLLEGGEIGDLLTVTVTWAGRLFLTGTHSYDLVNYFLGDIPTRWLIGHAEEPSSEMSVVPTQRGRDVGGTAYAVYENGARAFFNGRDRHTSWRAEISGTKGLINLTPNDAQLWKQNDAGPFHQLLQHPFPQTMYYTAPMLYLLGDLIEAMEAGREPMSSGSTARHALELVLATHYSSQHDNTKVHFPLEELDMSPPFDWFGEGGQTLYYAPNAGARD